MSDRRLLAAGALALFGAVQIGALALVAPFQGTGVDATTPSPTPGSPPPGGAPPSPLGDPTDPLVAVAYVVGVLVASVGVLAAVRLGLAVVVRALAVLSTTALAGFAVLALAPPSIAVPLGVGIALVLAVAVFVRPEWYVIDVAGVLAGVGAAGLFGLSFGPLPVLVLLIALAVYDAVAVYGTGHMRSLAADAVTERLPVVLIVPPSLGYSYFRLSGEALTQGGADPDPAADGATPTGGDGADAGGGALILGLGDAVIPTVLATSAVVYLPTATLLPGVALTAPALGAVLGALAGLGVLLGLVFRGRAHAGLPLLNGGAIVGYLIGAVAAGVSLPVATGLVGHL